MAILAVSSFAHADSEKLILVDQKGHIFVFNGIIQCQRESLDEEGSSTAASGNIS
jgi:hypothetical protein